ncbi:MAG: hypothetical protein C5B53_01875, partial [Candidatus Melainabacteria bacterium]
PGTLGNSANLSGNSRPGTPGNRVNRNGNKRPLISIRVISLNYNSLETTPNRNRFRAIRARLVYLPGNNQKKALNKSANLKSNNLQLGRQPRV